MNDVQKNQPAKAPSQTPSIFDPFEWRPSEMFRRFGGLMPDLSRKSFPEFEAFDRMLSSFSAHPAVDVAERDGEFEITAELPGLDEKDVELRLSNGVLSISGEKKAEREEKDKNYHFSERRYGSFRRAFRVPEGVDESKIEAHFDRGVLTVKLPKTAETAESSKKIEIKSK